MKSKYSNQFKEEAIALSNKIGAKKSAERLGLPRTTLYNWRSRSRKKQLEKQQTDSGQTNGRTGKSPREIQLEQENEDLRRSNETLQEALYFLRKAEREGLIQSKL